MATGNGPEYRQMSLSEAPVVNSSEAQSRSVSKPGRKTFTDLVPNAMAAHIRAGRLGPNGEPVGTIQLGVTETVPPEKVTPLLRPTLPQLPDADVSPDDEDLNSAQAEIQGSMAFRLTHAKPDK